MGRRLLDCGTFILMQGCTELFWSVGNNGTKLCIGDIVNSERTTIRGRLSLNNIYNETESKTSFGSCNPNDRLGLTKDVGNFSCRLTRTPLLPQYWFLHLNENTLFTGCICS